MTTWKEGRQGTGYCKKTYISKSWIDLHILRYLPGQHIPPHKDALDDGKRHFRLNVLLCGEDSFVCEKVILKWWRFTLFRPDVYEHSVPPVSTTRKLLSIGFAI